MNQLLHLQKNKTNLGLRFAVLKALRDFFYGQNFTEIEAPLIVKLPGQEPNLSPIKILVNNEKKEEFIGYLHTSPEYTMKKMLATGWDKIFYLGKTFRNEESFGGTHNPEFTMCEWYRVNENMFKLMDDIEQMINFIQEKLTNFNIKKLSAWTRISMKELWQKLLQINLDNYLDEKNLLKLCREKGYNVSETESYEELFYRIFLNEIEPELSKMGAVFIYNYPAQMAALSKLSKDNPGYAERFEAYVDGLELANAFSELTNSQEQQIRLEGEKQTREKIGKEVFAVDQEFVEALNFMPESAGIALGVDRLVMVLTSCQNIDNVIVLPMSKIF